MCFLFVVAATLGKPVSLPLVGSSLVSHIILNLKKILEAYPEGIKVMEVLHIYSVSISLMWKTIGFMCIIRKNV